MEDALIQLISLTIAWGIVVSCIVIATVVPVCIAWIIIKAVLAKK